MLLATPEGRLRQRTLKVKVDTDFGNKIINKESAYIGTKRHERWDLCWDLGSSYRVIKAQVVSLGRTWELAGWWLALSLWASLSCTCLGAWWRGNRANVSTYRGKVANNFPMSVNMERLLPSRFWLCSSLNLSGLSEWCKPKIAEVLAVCGTWNSVYVELANWGQGGSWESRVKAPTAPSLVNVNVTRTFCYQTQGHTMKPKFGNWS